MATPTIIKEPSTWAGIGLVMTAIGQLIASHGTDLSAWATIGAAIVAIVRREQTPNP